VGDLEMKTLNWRNVPEPDFYLYARSFHAAAKKLARPLDSTSLTALDLCPVLLAYRKAVELSLKVIVLGEGVNFLPTKPDLISVHKTRSVSWLAQFVCQIITTLNWEEKFRCVGVESLADFRAVIEDVNAIDPDFHAFRCPAEPVTPDAVPGDLTTAVRSSVRRLDALLDLLDRTADALAAEWDLRSGKDNPDGGTEFKPTVH
jgi:hypothetical protein